MRLRKNKANTIKISGREAIRADFHRNKWAYIMFLPVLAWYIVFCYAPMYGAIIAFKDYAPSLGILGSKWVGLKWIKEFITDYYFLRLLKNTLIISITSLVVNFPIPIIFALLVNELRSKKYGKLVQTVTSLPHFISLMVICGMIKTFTMDTGIITKIVGALTGDYTNLLNKPGAFLPIYILSGTWQEMGWGAIIYIAALAGVDQELYEASDIDGAGKLRQVFAITLPSIAPTIVVMLILRIGGLLNVGYEKIILLYNEGIYDTADVISSFVYRRGIVQSDWSYSAAVGLFNMVTTLYPLLYVLFASLSDASELMQHSGLLFKPLGLNLSAYKIVIQDKQIISGYINTIIIVVGGVLISMILTILGAYTLSRKNLYWSKAISMIVIFPMFFSGGLIPFYLLIKNLRMLDSLWSLILPTALSTYNMMIMRTALASVPKALEEAAEIDGANPLIILFKILIPLTIPTIAVLILYYAVANWNSWFNAMLFLPNAKEKWPLQLVLRNLLIQNQTDDMTSGIASADKFSVSETIKYATIIVSTLPILCLYPFLQKYFLKGVMVGSVKG